MSCRVSQLLRRLNQLTDPKKSRLIEEDLVCHSKDKLLIEKDSQPVQLGHCEYPQGSTLKTAVCASTVYSLHHGPSYGNLYLQGN